MNPSEIPVIAIVGDVNHGKSSVVATLAEDDSVAIGEFPTTTECQRFRVRDLLEFVDTPGFQNAREALLELKEAGARPDPLAVFGEFIERHKEDRFFRHECRLFAPILGGATLLYVVDTAQPMEPRHEAEMEILRLTGAPRIALLNQTAEPRYRSAWEARLRQHFSAVIDFDAHRAGFSNRLALLEAMATVDAEGKSKLRGAIRILLQDREDKLDTAARIIIDLLADVLPARRIEALRDPLRVSAQRREVELRFQEELIEREKAAHRELVKTFVHRRVAVDDVSGAIFSDGLFVEQTWSLLGLRGWRLVATGAGTGALVGAKVDLLLGFATWGLGAAVGGVLGGGAAMAGSRTAPRLKVKLPYFSRAIIGTELVAGPIAHPNFPWIVLDRAVGVFLSVSRRAHARQDREALNAEALAGHLRETEFGSEGAPEEFRKILARAFRDMRKGKFDDARRESAILALKERLREISQ